MTVSLDSLTYIADTYLLPTGLRILVAALIFFVGRSLARAVGRAIDRMMDRSKLDVSLRKFLGDVIYAVLFVAVVIAALDTAGIKTTAVLAILGAAGLAVGLALQGSLSNFAAAAKLFEVKQLLEGIAHGDSRIESSPPPAIDVAEITDAAVKLHFRPWTAMEHYEPLATETMERIIRAMDTAHLKFSVALQAA